MKVHHFLLLVCLGLISALNAVTLRSGRELEPPLEADSASIEAEYVIVSHDDCPAHSALPVAPAPACQEPVLASVRDGAGRSLPLCGFEPLISTGSDDYYFFLRLAAWWVHQQCEAVKALQAAEKASAYYFYSDDQLVQWLTEQRAKALQAFRSQYDEDIDDEGALYNHLYKNRCAEIVRRFEQYLTGYALSSKAIKNGVVPRTYVETLIIETFAREIADWFKKAYHQVHQDLIDQVYEKEIAAAPTIFRRGTRAVRRLFCSCCIKRR